MDNFELVRQHPDAHDFIRALAEANPLYLKPTTTDRELWIMYGRHELASGLKNALDRIGDSQDVFKQT